MQNEISGSQGTDCCQTQLYGVEFILRSWCLFSYYPMVCHNISVLFEISGSYTSFTVEPCTDTISVNSNQLMHISVFIKNTLKVHLKFLLPRHVFGSQRDPSSGGHHQILAKVCTGSMEPVHVVSIVAALENLSVCAACCMEEDFIQTFNVFLINTEMCMSWLLLILILHQCC